MDEGSELPPVIPPARPRFWRIHVKQNSVNILVNDGNVRPRLDGGTTPFCTNLTIFWWRLSFSWRPKVQNSRFWLKRLSCQYLSLENMPSNEQHPSWKWFFCFFVIKNQKFWFAFAYLIRRMNKSLTKVILNVYLALSGTRRRTTENDVNPTLRLPSCRRYSNDRGLKNMYTLHSSNSVKAIFSPLNFEVAYTTPPLPHPFIWFFIDIHAPPMNRNMYLNLKINGVSLHDYLNSITLVTGHGKFCAPFVWTSYCRLDKYMCYTYQNGFGLNLLLYILCGIVGYMCTLLYTRVKKGETYTHKLRVKISSLLTTLLLQLKKGGVHKIKVALTL